MSDQAAETPLLDLARNVPIDLRGEWEIQWDEDGTPTGHSMAPVGSYVHRLADEIERLQSQLGAVQGQLRNDQNRVLKLCKQNGELQTRLDRAELLVRYECGEGCTFPECDCKAFKTLEDAYQDSQASDEEGQRPVGDGIANDTEALKRYGMPLAPADVDKLFTKEK